MYWAASKSAASQRHNSKVSLYLSLWYMRGDQNKNWNYFLEGGPLVVHASLTKWVFCISVPAHVIVKGCVWLQ